MKQVHFLDKYGSFSVDQAENISYLYFPLASEKGLKSCVTPNLGGDSKTDQETFLLEPVSAENLHNNRSVRNFWIVCENEGIFSATGASAGQEAVKFSDLQDDSKITAGFMWHELQRKSRALSLETKITSFIPAEDNVEIMHIRIRNLSDNKKELLPYAAIPIYARSADNIRDHRNVTSMLHRIKTDSRGVLVCPTMSFDEKGHRPNSKIYYVYGLGADGQKPEYFYPTVEDFLGEGGTYTHPRSVYESLAGQSAGYEVAGKEAMGAFRFPKICLAPKEDAEYIVFLGLTESQEDIESILEKYNSPQKVLAALHSTKEWWKEKVNIGFHTKDADFDRLMKWICFQPFLRRLFGCSFLPHHDYGRGGRGWRDLWQDCLSLLLMDPDGVRQMIAKNFGGVRIDGTNATIIGEGDGNFIADRNGIARVWMDHALWPQMTVKLYIDQTGDIDILNHEVSYFKDAQTERGSRIDTLWDAKQGNLLRTENDEIYKGSILEHLLIQQLSAFYEVGEHNIYRLRGADWNDALDMASERGESVAFTCAYAGNLRELASMIRLLESHRHKKEAEFMEELQLLLEDSDGLFEDISAKKAVLKKYMQGCSHRISGRRRLFSLSRLAQNLEHKADLLTKYIQKHEWIDGGSDLGWFNSYYDNHGQKAEGFFPNEVRMMLIGQVFSIMGEVASKEQIQKIVKSADAYLYRKEIGGYRLNTDFHELKFDMGRMFGFAYGEKENGAVFSHMVVMYANALCRRGFAKEAWKALKTLADASLNFEKGLIYPGIPEYFRSDGRGMYHYLTGAASWFMMTMLTQLFGIRGEVGNLIIYPKLTADQFDDPGRAGASLVFAGKRLEVIYENPKKKDFGEYKIASLTCDGKTLPTEQADYALISREILDGLSEECHQILVTLN